MDEEQTGQSPMQEEAAFDQNWDSALRGELPPPTGQSGEPQAAENPQPGEQPAGQEAPPAAGSPEPPAETVPESLLQRAREAGFDDLDSALKAARNFQSIRGQLPNLEQKWKEQYVAPLEQRIQVYEQRERQALDQYINYDPATNLPRSLEERQRLTLQIQQAQAEEQAAAQAALERTQQAEQERQRQADLATREQRVAQAEQGNLKLIAINSLQPYTQSLAQTYKVPVAEIQRYIEETGMVARVQALEDMRQYGSMVQALEDHVKIRASQLQEEAARLANAGGRYRDMGNGGAGAGGQQSGDRWTKANDQDFERAWERAMRGELV